MARRKKKYNLPKISNENIIKPKAVIYTRVSSEKQVAEWHWLESQERLCRERAKENEIEVIKVFQDGWISGRTDKRNGLQEMLNFLRKENKKYTKVNYIIVDDIDRIARDVIIWTKVYEEAKSLWIKIHSLKQKVEDTPEWEMINQITAVIKWYEAKVNQRRVKDRMKARLLDWYWTFYPPDWYEFIVDEKEWKILVWNENALLIKEWLELFAKWIILTQADLVKFFNEKWMRTKKWNKIHPSYVERLLTRDRLLFYSWHIYYPEWWITEPIPAKHKQLIDLKTAEKILQRINPNKIVERKYYKEEILGKLPLRWLLIDPTSWNKRTWWPSKNKKWNYYFYYTLRYKTEDWKSKTENILNEKLHQEFKKFLQQFSISEAIAKLIKEILKDILKDKLKYKKQWTANQTKRLKEIEEEKELIDKRITTLLKQWKEDKIEYYENKLIELEEEEKLIKENLSKPPEEIIDIDEIFSNTLEFFTNPAKIWDKLDYKLKREFVAILFDWKIYYNKKMGFQTPKIPVIFRDLKELLANNSHLVEMTGFEPVSGGHNRWLLPS